jgi:hypothetical protein
VYTRAPIYKSPYLNPSSAVSFAFVYTSRTFLTSPSAASASEAIELRNILRFAYGESFATTMTSGLCRSADAALPPVAAR